MTALQRHRQRGSDAHPTRREVMGLVGAFFTGTAANIVGGRALSWLDLPGNRPSLKMSGLSFLEPARSSSELDSFHSALNFQLFLGSRATTTEFVLPDRWRDMHGNVTPPDISMPNGKLTYGHEASVFRGISTFLHNEIKAGWEETDKTVNSEEKNSRILLGSGVSNQDTEWIMGTPAEPRFRNPLCELHYSLGRHDTGIVKRHQYGRVTEEYVHTICDHRGRALLRPASSSDFLIEDYLLVSRIPGREEGTTITIFAGLHGPGTRSAELIFSSLPLRELTELASRIGWEEGEVPHFQAVFRASMFQRGLATDLTDSDVATRLELVTETCPPKRIVTS